MRRTLPGIVTALVAVTGATAAAGPARAAEPVPRFLDTQYDSPGTDTRTDASLNAEWITLVNEGPTAIDLKGWKVADASRTYAFGNVTIAARGGKVRLHTGKGVDTATQVYWGSGNHVWNNTGDTATLVDRAGKVRDVCVWESKARRTYVAC